MSSPSDDFAFGEGAARLAFAVLFPVPECACERENCDICASWQLTPRTADLLHSALEIMADQAFDDIDVHGSEPVEREDAGDWGYSTGFPVSPGTRMRTGGGRWPGPVTTSRAISPAGSGRSRGTTPRSLSSTWLYMMPPVTLKKRRILKTKSMTRSLITGMTTTGTRAPMIFSRTMTS